MPERGVLGQEPATQRHGHHALRDGAMHLRHRGLHEVRELCRPVVNDPHGDRVSLACGLEDRPGEGRHGLHRPVAVVDPDVEAGQVAVQAGRESLKRGRRPPTLPCPQRGVDAPGASPEGAALVAKQEPVAPKDPRCARIGEHEACDARSRHHAHARKAAERSRVRGDGVVAEPHLAGAGCGANKPAQASPIDLVCGSRGQAQDHPVHGPDAQAPGALCHCLCHERHRVAVHAGDTRHLHDRGRAGHAQPDRGLAAVNPENTHQPSLRGLELVAPSRLPAGPMATSVTLAERWYSSPR